MIDPDLSIENLRTCIEEAFTSVEPPDPKNIIEHDCPECRAVRRVFRHEDWCGVKAEKVDWGHDKLSLFTPHAFQHFLPAFMLYSLDEPSDIVCELLIYSLISHEEKDEWWQKRLHEFTPKQKAACRLFLRWIQLQPKYASDSEAIEHAVAQWRQGESG
jgi:hypothetical protein